MAKQRKKVQIPQQLNADIFFKSSVEEVECMLRDYLNKSFTGYKLEQKSALFQRGMQFYHEFHQGVKHTRVALLLEKNPGYHSLDRYFRSLMSYIAKNVQGQAVPKPDKTYGPIKGSEFFVCESKQDALKLASGYFDDPELNASPKFLEIKEKLIFISGLAWEKYQAGEFISVRGLSREFNISRQTLVKHLGELVDYNIFEARNAEVMKKTKVLTIETLRDLKPEELSSAVQQELSRHIRPTSGNQTTGLVDRLIWVASLFHADLLKGNPRGATYYAGLAQMDPRTLHGNLPGLFPRKNVEEGSPLPKRSRGMDILEQAITLAEQKNLQGPLQCACCKATGWQGLPIHVVATVDHIDGDRNNNTPENLRLLCDNCHQVTVTNSRKGIFPVEGPINPETSNLILNKADQEKHWETLFKTLRRYNGKPKLYFATLKLLQQRRSSARQAARIISVAGMAAGLRPCQCEKCGLDSWLGGYVYPVLQGHHRNGVNSDNRPENIATLCANCHMTEHYEPAALSREFKQKFNVAYWLAE